MARVVTEGALGRGAYDLQEASYLLGVTDRTLVSWARPSAGGLPPLIEPSLGWAYTFHDLVSLAMAAVLRQRDVRISGIRRTHAYLQQRHGEPRPFARRDIIEGLATALGSVITAEDGVDTTRSGEMVLLGVIKEWLVPLTYDADQLARLWKPQQLVLLDPAIQVGQPCVEGTRVTTSTVAGRYLQNERLAAICKDLDLTVEEGRACLTFERKLKNGQGLALAPT